MELSEMRSPKATLTMTTTNHLKTLDAIWEVNRQARVAAETFDFDTSPMEDWLLQTDGTVLELVDLEKQTTTIIKDLQVRVKDIQLQTNDNRILKLAFREFDYAVSDRLIAFKSSDREMKPDDNWKREIQKSITVYQANKANGWTVTSNVLLLIKMFIDAIILTFPDKSYRPVMIPGWPLKPKVQSPTEKPAEPAPTQTVTTVDADEHKQTTLVRHLMLARESIYEQESGFKIWNHASIKLIYEVDENKVYIESKELSTETSIANINVWNPAQINLYNRPIIGITLSQACKDGKHPLFINPKIDIESRYGWVLDEHPDRFKCLNGLILVFTITTGSDLHNNPYEVSEHWWHRIKSGKYYQPSEFVKELIKTYLGSV